MTPLMQQQKGRKASAKPLDFAVLALLPWLVFSIIVSLFAFAFQDFEPLVWALVVASGFLALLFLTLGSATGRPAQVALGLLVLTAVAVSVPIGMSVQSRYMARFWAVDSGAEYRAVAPLEPAASYEDASVVTFEPGTIVDTERAAGYMKRGVTYCAAPVVSQRLGATAGGTQPAASAPAAKAQPEAAGVLAAATAGGAVAAPPQFWAVGRDCCGQRGSFRCGELAVKGALGAVRVDTHVEEYEAAVRMASSVHGLSAQAQPFLLRWTADPAEYRRDLWSHALTATAAASGIHLVGSAGAGVLLARGLLR